MKARFSFDKAAVERRGCTLEDVHRTVKNLFAVHDLPCISDCGALVFEDKGHGDDFAIMWDIILSLLRADWFMDCAASCVWQDEGSEEDILSQSEKVRGTVRQQPPEISGLRPPNFNHPTAQRMPRQRRGRGPHRRGR